MAAVFTLDELARKVGAEVVGEASTEIRGVRPFEEAGPGDITLAANRKFLKNIESTAASALIVGKGAISAAKPLLKAVNPKLAFAQVLALFHPRPFRPQGISPLAAVGKGCRIADDVSIGPFVTVGDSAVIEDQVTLHSGVSVGAGSRIGSGCILHPNVTLYPGVSLGRGVILHAGCVIGADGFGYVFDGRRQFKIEQTGTVDVGDEVEIGANSCVDRATFGATVIERGVKLDNHVHIGHNCRIGENTVIVGCVGISGSVTIGRNCVLAGQCGASDHVRIGDGVTVLARTVVNKDVPDGKVISGNPWREHREELKTQALIRRLPDLQRELKDLRRRLERLEKGT